MAVPKLRFKAEDGSEFPEWEEKRLGEVCSSLSYGINAPAKKYDGENKYIRITDIDEITHEYLNADVVSPDGKLEEKFVVKENDILFARTGASTGKTYLYNKKDGKLYYAGFLICAHIKSEYDSRFVFYQTLTQKYFSWVKKTSSRSGQPGINSKEYSAFSFFLPSLQEQQKIADFLSTIDSIISSQKEELAAWEQRKKGIMQKLFSQEVRFKADDGSEFPEWEEKRLGDVLTENNLPIAKPNKGYERLGLRSHCKGTFHEVVPAGEGLDVDTMYVVEPHNLIVNITFAWEHAIAVTDEKDAGKLVSHRFPQYKFNDKYYWKYFYYDIQDTKLKYDLGIASPGGAGRNRVLNKKLFLNIKRLIPSLPEQKKIADCLSSVDEVINKEKEELEKWQELKKGLLQQMFV